jgi:hypothetical protein
MGFELFIGLQLLCLTMLQQPGAVQHAQMNQASAQIVRRSADPKMTIEEANRAATYRAAWAISQPS